jgi:hypothetical protein
MRRLQAAIATVQQLLSSGEAAADAFEALVEARRLGLWHKDQTANRAVTTTSLVNLAAMLPNVAETVAAVFACEPELRSAWLRVVAARLREAGKRRDATELCNAVDQLGAASRRVRQLLPDASLQPTGHQDLEIALFGAPAEQAVIWPKLLRVIGATADLVEGGQRRPAAAIPAVAPLDPKQSWCSGRIIQLPVLDDSDPADVTCVLAGRCAPLSRAERVADDSPSQALMRWVLYRPWGMLLAQIAFTQEAWEAEQISGRLALELAEDQLGNPYEPGRVDVVITTADGDEVLCGTLGDLLRRVLARLDMTLLARPEEGQRLDERLAAVIHLLLEQKVWRFEASGAGSRRPGYVIDDDFSTSCYRAFGSKYFYRGGSLLTSAIRLTCEQWAKEKLSEAGAVRAGMFGEVVFDRELV